MNNVNKHDFVIGKLYIIKDIDFYFPSLTDGNIPFKGDFIFLFLGASPYKNWSYYKLYSPYHNQIREFSYMWPSFDRATELKDNEQV